MSTWMLWFGIVLLLGCSLPAGYAWYGKILGIVKKGKSKENLDCWDGFGYIRNFSYICSDNLRITPRRNRSTKGNYQSLASLFWVATAVLLIGALPFGMVAQSRVLDMVKVETVQKVFKIGFINIINKKECNKCRHFYTFYGDEVSE